jgi:hypothetical protein
MKSLLVTGLSFCLLAATVRAQTDPNAAPPAAAPAPSAKAPAAGTKVDDAAARLDADTQTNAPAKATLPYPVTAIVVSNTITFPILLSKNSDPLMTNALYRRTFGRKVIFTADLAIMTFDIDKLHPSVIAQLDLDPGKVKADQENLDKQNQAWAVQNQQKNQQFLSAEAAALAKNQAAAQAAATNNGGAGPNPNPSNPNAAGAGKQHHRKTTTPPPAN